MGTLQPFWDNRFDEANPGPYGSLEDGGQPAEFGFNGLYAKNKWDSAFIKSVRVPGIVTVDGRRTRHLYTIQKPGISPIVSAIGFEPFEFTMTVKIWTPAHWAKLQEIMAFLMPRWLSSGKNAPLPTAFDVYHPYLAALSVHSCICKSIGPLTGDQVKTMAIVLMEYVKGKSAVSKITASVVDKQYKADGLANQQVKAANGKVTPVTPTQGPQQKPSQSVSLRPTP